eukprot:gene16513-22538_t
MLKDNGMESFFDDIHKYEAMNTSFSLANLDFNLYEKYPVDDKHNYDLLDYGQLKRYESVGYDANYDCVEPREFASWRNEFSYLKVLGNNANNCKLTEGSYSQSSLECSYKFGENDGENDKSFANECVNYVDNLDIAIDSSVDLVVTGISCNLVPSESNIIFNDDFVDIVDGSIEEFMEINFQPGGFEQTNDLSPSNSMKDEVLGNLMEMVWSESVQQMASFVKRVLSVANVHKLYYSETKESEEYDGWD